MKAVLAWSMVGTLMLGGAALAADLKDEVKFEMGSAGAHADMAPSAPPHAHASSAAPAPFHPGEYAPPPAESARTAYEEPSAELHRAPSQPPPRPMTRPTSISSS